MADQKKENLITVKRIPGEGTKCVATLKLEFDWSDQESVDKFAAVMRAVVPEAERDKFVDDVYEALKVSA